MIKKILPIAIVVVCVVAAFIGGYYAREAMFNKQLDDAKAAGQEIVSKLTSGDNAGAYALVSSGMQGVQTSEEFDKAMANLKSESATLNDPSVTQGDTSILYIQKVDNLPESELGSTTGVFYITLVKEDGSWKASSLNVQ